jgi:hypothetical protein
LVFELFLVIGRFPVIDVLDDLIPGRPGHVLLTKAPVDLIGLHGAVDWLIFGPALLVKLGLGKSTHPGRHARIGAIGVWHLREG